MPTSRAATPSSTCRPGSMRRVSRRPAAAPRPAFRSPGSTAREGALVPVEVIGIDHVYVTVRELVRSQRFYDGVMRALGYRRVESVIGGDPHVHYYNRQVGFSLRPARPGPPAPDP